MRSFLRNIVTFYRYDCCWPYAASFFLTLGIFALDFGDASAHFHGASLAAYGILVAYYLYLVRLHVQKRMEKKAPVFFVAYLSVKVVLWGIILVLLSL